jgi:hypothetical protein
VTLTDHKSHVVGVVQWKWFCDRGGRENKEAGYNETGDHGLGLVSVTDLVDSHLGPVRLRHPCLFATKVLRTQRQQSPSLDMKPLDRTSFAK